MISVDDAVARVIRAFAPLSRERVALSALAGRVLAEDVLAQSDQPPAAMSAMDGYAVHAATTHAGDELVVVGDAPAGRPYPGTINAGKAVRLFTGAVVPNGADAVVLQEDTELLPASPSSPGSGARVRLREAPRPGENVRPQALDFRAGEVLLRSGHRLGARDLALIAAADVPDVLVTVKPRVAIVATGDELSRPGEPRKAGGVVASSTYALQAMVKAWGGEAIDLGILPDKPAAFAKLPAAAKSVDLIVTQGGASVGDHDLVQSALAPHGFVLDFWKIAMRPGKPLIFGHLGQTPFLGLPGNPVSAMVCAILFIHPAIASMLGQVYEAPIARATLGSALRANGRRQDYIRARLKRENGVLLAEPFAQQDSLMQKIFASANALIVRPIDAPAAKAGDLCDVLLLEGW